MAFGEEAITAERDVRERWELMRTRKEHGRTRKARSISDIFLTFCAFVIFNGVADGQSLPCRSLFSVPEAAAVARGENPKWGLIDCKGNLVAKIEYDQAFPFNDGVSVVVDQRGTTLVDIRGKRTSLPEIRLITAFSEGLAIGSKGDAYFIFDKTGKTVAPLPPNFEPEDIPRFSAGEFMSGLAPINGKDGVGFIDERGVFVISPKFDYTNGFFDSMATVSIDGKRAVIDRKGDYILPPTEDSVDDPSEGWVCVGTRSSVWTWKYIDRTGRTQLILSYDYAGSFHEGLAQVEADGKWGYVDKRGKLVIPFRYDDVSDFSSGFAGVTVGLKLGFIDKKGRFLARPKFDYLYKIENGLAYVTLGDREGYVDRYGKWIWHTAR